MQKNFKIIFQVVRDVEGGVKTIANIKSIVKRFEKIFLDLVYNIYCM